MSGRKHKARRKKRPPRPSIESLDPVKFYDAKYLATRWGCHVITIWKWVQRGHLTKPTRLGPNISRWLGADIIEHERQAGEARS